MLVSSALWAVSRIPVPCAPEWQNHSWQCLEAVLRSSGSPQGPHTHSAPCNQEHGRQGAGSPVGRTRATMKFCAHSATKSMEEKLWFHHYMKR